MLEKEWLTKPGKTKQNGLGSSKAGDNIWVKHILMPAVILVYKSYILNTN